MRRQHAKIVLFTRLIVNNYAETFQLPPEVAPVEVASEPAPEPSSELVAEPLVSPAPESEETELPAVSLVELAVLSSGDCGVLVPTDVDETMLTVRVMVPVRPF